MGQIALALCVLFILFLLVRDMFRRRDLSWALWVPTFLLMILGSRPLSMWLGGRGTSGSGNEGPRSHIDELFFVATLGLSWVIATSRHVKWTKYLAANGSIMILYLFFALSIIWSGDPLGSTTRLCKDFGLLFVVAAIFSEKDPLAALQAVYYRTAAVLFPLSLVVIRWFPSIGRDYSIAGSPMAIGVTLQKNTLGEIVLVCSLIMIWSWVDPHPAKKTATRKLQWDLVILLGIGAWLLKMCQSRSGLVSILIGGLLILTVGRSSSKFLSRLALAGALTTPFLLLTTQYLTSFIAPLVQAMGRNMTFTGRTDIWAQITSSTVNPLIGTGYWNFWGGPGGASINWALDTVVPNAHCGYLDIYLDGGWIGLCFLYFMLIMRGRRIIKGFSGSRFQAVRFAILIAAIIYNLSESIFLRMSPLWLTTLVAMVDFPQMQEAVEPTKSVPVEAVRRPVFAPQGKGDVRPDARTTRPGLIYDRR